MAINIERRRFKQNHSSASAHQTRETDAPAVTTPAITVLGVFIIKENGCHSPIIKAREGMRTGEGEDTEKMEHMGEKTNTKGRTRIANFFPCFFSKKQRRSCLTIVRHKHVNRGHPLAL